MPSLIHTGLTNADVFVDQFLEGIDPTEVLLVHGRHSYRNSGAQAFFERWLTSRTPSFEDFSANPKVEDVDKGSAILKQRSIHRIIAVGGGSVLDMAKLINHRQINQPCPLLAAPTTSGSGSEATHFAVCYHGCEKRSIAHPLIRPSHVLLVPEWTYSMSPYQTACSGIDALAQGIESSWARSATDESRSYARKAIDLALRHLPDAVQQPKPEHRAAMQQAAYLAGQAINISKTTAPHAYSYILTTTFGLSHGHAVALLLPHFIAYHAAQGVQIQSITHERIGQLIESIGLSTHLDIGKVELIELLRAHVNQERLKNNPVTIPDQFIQQLCSSIAAR